MASVRVILGGALVVALSVGAAHALEMFIYPSKGQSAQQQEKDKFECYGWSKGQSGFDPMAPPTASTPPPSRGGRSVAGGAIGGGALGAGVGAVGAAGSNAAASRDYRDWERREATSYAAKRGQYNRAFAACMEGRGYTVK